MTRWHWIRHGPTHQKSFCGWRDVPADLSDQAHLDRLNAMLPDNALVVSSDLIRASATADRITRAHTRLPHSPDIREFHFGVWDGMHFEQVSARDPELSRNYWEEPGDHRAPGGESWNEAAARINRFVDAMNARHPNRDIIAVAHFGTILTQVQRARAITPYQALAHEIDNLSVTQLRFDGQSWYPDAINQIP